MCTPISDHQEGGGGWPLVPRFSYASASASPRTKLVPYAYGSRNCQEVATSYTISGTKNEIIVWFLRDIKPLSQFRNSTPDRHKMKTSVASITMYDWSCMRRSGVKIETS